jgi:glutamate/tyrosine decarboxylase-like PLP-dependent enzyme
MKEDTGEKELRSIIELFSDRAKNYIENMDTRGVFPADAALEDLDKLNVELQDEPLDPLFVLDELDRLGSPATVSSAGKRYFGFVVGGSLPAALGANLMAGVWDQNAGPELASPIASYIETICRKWLNSLLGLPSETQVGFVTGATMAKPVSHADQCLVMAYHPCGY